MSCGSSACMVFGPYYVCCENHLVKGGNNRAGAAFVPWKLCTQQIKAPPGSGLGPTSLSLSPSTGCMSAQKFATGSVKFLPRASRESIWPAGSSSACNELYLHSVLISWRQKWLWFNPAHSICYRSINIRLCFVEHQGRKPGLWNYLHTDVWNQKYTVVGTYTFSCFPCKL